MSLQQPLQGLFDHGTSQVLNGGSQHDSQLPIAMLKSNFLDLLRIDEGLEVDNLWIAETGLLADPNQKRRGTISANRVADDGLKRVIDVVAG